MWADILTKPLQGQKFRDMRAFLQNCPRDYDDDAELKISMKPQDVEQLGGKWAALGHARTRLEGRAVVAWCTAHHDGVAKQSPCDNFSKRWATITTHTNPNRQQHSTWISHQQYSAPPDQSNKHAFSLATLSWLAGPVSLLLVSRTWQPSRLLDQALLCSASHQNRPHTVNFTIHTQCPLGIHQQDSRHFWQRITELCTGSKGRLSMYISLQTSRGTKRVC